MNRVFLTVSVFLISLAISSYGCNIVPKSVQYQKEEEGLIGNTDTINPRIEEIQIVLRSLGYDTGTVDGKMGAETRKAIKEFQESIGIKNTGYIDKLTLTQIEDIRRANDTRRYTVSVRDAVLEGKEEGTKPTTKDIQRALKNAGFDPGAIDGKIGPRTKQAVKEFQRTKGLTPDGVVGSKTWAELGKYLER